MQTLNRKGIISVTSLILVGFLAFYFSAAAQEETTPTDEATPTLEERQNNINQRREQQETRQQQTEDRIETRREAQSELIDQRQEVRTNNIDARQELRTERVEGRQELQAERKGALEAARQNRVLNLSANISNRMEGAIARLATINERLGSRIEKLTAAGIDTNAATAKLKESNDLLAQARDNLANIDSLVYDATTAPEPKAGWQNVRAVYAESARLIRGSHLALREVIGLLKTSITDRERNLNAEVRANNNETEQPE